jgi:hypothetical protein
LEQFLLNVKEFKGKLFILEEKGSWDSYNHTLLITIP